MWVGDLLIGLAADQPGVRAALRHALAEHLVDEVVDPNYTVHVADDPADFHRVAWGGCVVVRTRDLRRLAAALARHIGGHAPPAPGVMRTDSLAVVSDDGTAWLLPGGLRRRIARYERRLRQSGFVVDYGPWSDVEVATGELVVAAPQVAATVFEELGDLAPPGGALEPAVPEGRYRLSHWVFERVHGDEEAPPRVESVVRALTSLPEPVRDRPSIVVDLAMMFQNLDVRMLPVEPPNGFVLALAELR